ncbi:MAG: ATP-binding cassette domain-containing protein [Candidatus Izemoplasmatales bacterium]|jgi:ABC-type lipoprotein export system ATPase subunit|nr:ATP-binding cassette domain-containing protein [Candidatus Izemoplasmatales bacterium]
MIKLSNVSKFYNSNDVIALGLRKVNLELNVNEFVAIVGESGSGKTTLLNVISGIDTYEDGEMYINGEETSYFSVSDMENYRKKYVAFVFQDYNLIDSYTVLQNVEAPLLLSGYPKDKIKKRAMEIIKKVGLEKHAHHKSTKLSGGQKQRVVIARALAKDCPIIAADEPTGNLDSESAKQIIKLLADISKDKLVIMVTHDFSQVENYATRKIRIYDGEIVEDKELKKVEKKDLPKLEDKEFKINFLSNVKLSLRNLLAVPKKTILMVLVFTFFSIFIGLAYGGYTIVSQESAFPFNSHFQFSPASRLVVKRLDNQPLTQADLDQLASFSQVGSIITEDYVLDAWKILSSKDEGLIERNDDYIDYLPTVFLPLSILDENTTLPHGTWPEDDDEIVLAVSDYYYEMAEGILDTYLVEGYGGFAGQREYQIKAIVTNDIIPGNKMKNYNFVFVSDAIWEVVSEELFFNYVEAQIHYPAPGMDFRLYKNTLKIDPTLEDFEFRVASGSYNLFCSGVCEYDVDFSIKSYYVDESYDATLIVDEGTNYNYIYLNQDTFDLIFYDEIYQVSLLTNTEINVEGLAKQIARTTDNFGLKYKVIYPFDSAPIEQYMGLLLLLANIGMLTVLVITMVGSTFITYIIFKMIINTKLHDYAIFRTIGANQSVIKKFIYFENFYVVIISFIIFLGISLALPNNIPEPFNAFKVFDIPKYFIYFLLLVLMALFVSRKYCNKIFSSSVSKTLKTDLE